jgi:hypothetical protein
MATAGAFNCQRCKIRNHRRILFAWLPVKRGLLRSLRDLQFIIAIFLNSSFTRVFQIAQVGGSDAAIAGLADG